MDFNLNNFLAGISSAAVAVSDEAVVAANAAARENFMAELDNPVLVPGDSGVAEIDGTPYIFCAELADGNALYIAMSSEYLALVDNSLSLLNTVQASLRESLHTTQASLKLLSSTLDEESGTLEADEARRYITMARRSQALLARTVENLTDSLSSGDVIDTFPNIDLRRVCAEFTSTVNVLLDEKYPLVKFRDLTAGRDTETAGDRVSLERMLLNLLSNALVHHSESENDVVITLSTVEGGYSITVANTSDDTELARFAGPPKAMGSLGVGVGMGLTAALKIAKTHAGNIMTFSCETGTIVTVTLPKRKCNDEYDDFYKAPGDSNMIRMLTGLAEFVSHTKFDAPYLEN
jgi:signal transduction histidine kinase